MKSLRSRRPSASLVISCLALFIALGGTVYASSHISGKTIKKNSTPGNRIKSNTLPGNRVKKGTLTGKQVKADSLTGTQINESTLAQVPSAASAVSATNASNVGTVKTFSAGASDNQLVSLVKTADFELMGICDPNGDFDPPGVQFEDVGTAMVIYNRSATPVFADSEDDVNYRMTQNEGVVFNYNDNGDGGEAMALDGHFLAAPSWANELGDNVNYVDNPETGDSYSFPTDCHFAGAALVG